MQEQIPGAFHSCGCKEYENDRGSSLLSAKVCEISENVRKEELESILGRKFMGYVSGNFSDFERQKQRDQPLQITIQ